MSGTDKLIQKITEDARADAEKTIADAEKKALEIQLESRLNVEKIKSDGEAAAQSAENDILFRAKKNAELEAKKVDLAMRRSLIDDVFASALSALHSADATTQGEILKRIIFKEAEGGEKLYPSKTHAFVIAGILHDINSMLEKERKAPITLCDAKEDIPSGFILEGEG